MRKRRKGSYGVDVLSVCERDMQIENGENRSERQTNGFTGSR